MRLRLVVTMRASARTTVSTLAGWVLNSDSMSGISRIRKPVSVALRRTHQEILLHTGQHYDYLMSQIFLRELGLPEPDYNLAVGSGSHGRQTGELLAEIEKVLTPVAKPLEIEAFPRPQVILVIGVNGSGKTTTLYATLKEIYDPGAKFPKDKLRKEQDIFDVWFESGENSLLVLGKVIRTVLNDHDLGGA